MHGLAQNLEFVGQWNNILSQYFVISKFQRNLTKNQQFGR